MASTFVIFFLSLLAKYSIAQYPQLNSNGPITNLAEGNQPEESLCLNNFCTRMSGSCLAKNQQCILPNKHYELYGLSRGGAGCTCNCCVPLTTSPVVVSNGEVAVNPVVAFSNADPVVFRAGGNTDGLSRVGVNTVPSSNVSNSLFLQNSGVVQQPGNNYTGQECSPTFECLANQGICVPDESHCDFTMTYATKQCTSPTNCACCIPRNGEACYPINKDACSSPGSYCQDIHVPCAEGYKEVEETCSKMKYIPISEFIVPVFCKCCTKGTNVNSENSDDGCPKCGLENLKYKKHKNKNKLAKHVDGGIEIKPPHKYPWLVLLKSYFRGIPGYCGGSIINKKYVITGSHCLYDGKDYGCNYVDRTEVHLGLHKVDQSDEISDVTRIVGVDKYIKHPDYKCGKSDDNDIALLKLDETLDFFNDEQLKGIRPICLPSDDKEKYNGYRGIVAGWGATPSKRMKTKKKSKSDKIPQSVPSEVSVPISKEFCKSYPDNSITGNMLCAGDQQEGKYSCSGDSGGPLAVLDEGRFVLVGIVSFGPEDGDCDGPGVYTRVSRYLEWIDENTKDLDCNILKKNDDEDDDDDDESKERK